MTHCLKFFCSMKLSFFCEGVCKVKLILQIRSSVLLTWMMIEYTYRHCEWFCERNNIHLVTDKKVQFSGNTSCEKQCMSYITWMTALIFYSQKMQSHKNEKRRNSKYRGRTTKKKSRNLENQEIEEKSLLCQEKVMWKSRSCG